MADIKLTLTRGKQIDRELLHMRQQGGLFYPLNEQPQNAGPEDWVYFILRDQLVARAVVVAFRCFTNDDKMPILDYEGNDIWKPGLWVLCEGMEVLEAPVASPGFQGFRYLAGEEIQAFAQAFM